MGKHKKKKEKKIRGEKREWKKGGRDQRRKTN